MKHVYKSIPIFFILFLCLHPHVMGEVDTFEKKFFVDSIDQYTFPTLSSDDYEKHQKNDRFHCSAKVLIPQHADSSISLHNWLKSLSLQEMVQHLEYKWGMRTSKQRKKILSQFSLYHYESFLEVIKTFDEYPAFICALVKRMYKAYSLDFYWTRLYGIKEKILALQNEIIARQKDDVQKRCRQQQQEAHNAKINSIIRSQRTELEAYKARYQNMCDLDLINDDHKIRYINRIKEIDNFFAQGPEFYDRDYCIYNETVGYIAQCRQSKHVVQEFSHCYGTRLQQIAHKECVDALNSYGRSYKTVRIKSVNNLMLDSAQVGCQLARSGHIAQTFSCADLCWAIVDFFKAVSEGIFDGVSNVIDIALHPIQTVQNTVHGLATVAYYAGKTVHDLGAIGVNYCIDPELSKEQWSEYCDGVSQICDVMFDQLQELTLHDVVRGGVAFIVETVLMTRLLSSAHKVCKVAKNNLTQFAKATEAGEFIAVTAEGIPVKISNSNLQKFETAVKDVVSKSTRHIEVIHLELMQKVRSDIIVLRKLFDNKVKGFAEFANKHVKIDYEHILGMELSFTKKLMPQIKGFHHDFIRMIEESGVFEFVNKVMHKNGCYSAQLLYEGSIVKYMSTFFPSDWSREKVITKIYEAYENFVKSGKIATEKGGNYFISGLTKEGIEIEICITKKGLIKTAYPVLLK